MTFDHYTTGEEGGESLPLTAEPPEPWQEVVEAFRKEAFADDTVVPHSWFYEQLKMVDPKLANSGDQRDKLRLYYMTQVERVRDVLLFVDRIMLDNTWGRGYRVAQYR